MNSLVNFVCDNGGHNYNLLYKQNLLGNEFCSCNTTCVWYNTELMINSRLVNYTKLFQNNNIKFINNNFSQTYFYTKYGFVSRNIISRYDTKKIYGSVETVYSNGKEIHSYYKGLEDCRLVVWNDKLYTYGTRWDKVENKGCICLYELDGNMKPVTETVILPQCGNNCEKNWAAVDDKPFTFVYNHNPLIVISVDKDGKCTLIKQNEKNNSIDFVIKGSTQIVRYDENTYMSLVHTNCYYNDNNVSRSDYLTAFVFYDNDLNIIKMSDWFVFNSPMCEFTCGLAVHGEDVYITYSQLDCTSHLLVTNKNTIEKFITDSANLINTSDFYYFYTLAKEYENNNQNVSACVLYNYALVTTNEFNVIDDIKLECLIKTFYNICNILPDIKVTNLYEDIVNNLQNYIKQYPYSCELYYILSVVYKITGNFNESKIYKKMGDERKLNIHNYFFKYFNPNYL